MRHAHFFRSLLIPALAAALLLAACDGDEDTNGADGADADATDATPTETAAVTPGTDGSPASTADASPESDTTATATETIQPAEPVERDGVSFLAPEGWTGNADTWTSPDGDATLLFVAVEPEAGTEPPAEEILPEGATILDEQEIETPLGPATLHTIELTRTEGGEDGPVFERHAILRAEGHIYDWWLAADTVELLDENQDALEGVLDSLLTAEEDEG